MAYVAAGLFAVLSCLAADVSCEDLADVEFAEPSRAEWCELLSDFDFEKRDAAAEVALAAGSEP